jgi:MFS family permease
MNAKENPMKKVFSNHNFRYLWAGQGISTLGDQFEMIAAPWLVLNLTNDPLALGTVMALSSVPRAIFMLVGGAITDRFSARTIMLTSDVIRLVLTLLIALVVFTGAIQIWMLYAFALLFGLIGGFFSPAASSILPHIVAKDDIAAGNSLVQGTAQLANFVGPVLAGGLIALFANTPGAGSSIGMTGIALAFVLDALSFLVSILTLLAMNRVEVPRDEAAEDVWSAIKNGIRYAASDPLLRTMLLLVSAANLFFTGPLLVGIPVLAQMRLTGGAAAYGLIMGAYAGGNLVGILLGGSLPRPKPGQLNSMLVALLASFAAALIAFAYIRSTWLAFAVLLAQGVGNGYFAVTVFTLLQQRTPVHMTGRVMSLMLFSSAGLMPISQALSGFFIKLSLEGLFIAAGLLMLSLAVWTALDRSARTLGSLILDQSPAA